MAKAKFLGLLALPLLLLAIFWLPSASAQNPDNFKIVSFEADYYLDRTADKTSTLKVAEKIVAEFPDFDQNHGILRAIPKTYQDHTISLDVSSVKDTAGNAYGYSTYAENDNLVLKIGDANRYVRGQITYLISYNMRNVTGNFADHDELYWDVNGDQWPQTFDKVTARVHIPRDLATNLQDRQICYAGRSGQNLTDGCSTNRSENDEEIIVSAETTRALNAYETLTYVLGFSDGTFEPGPEIAREKQIQRVKAALFAVAVFLPPAAAFLVMFRRWRAFGDDPKGRGVIIPEYQPPKNFNTLSGDFLLAQKLRSEAFSAALIELAVKRYLTINEISKQGLFGKIDYELVLDKTPGELPKELKRVTEAIFLSLDPGAKIKISDISKSSSRRLEIAKQMKELEDHLSSDLHSRKYFIKDPKKIKKGYMLWATAVVCFGFVGLFIFPLTFLGAGLILASGVMLAFARIMPARTLLGVQTHDELLGLKDYIKLAEADRLKFGQSPEGALKIKSGSFDPNDPKMSIKLFESLLPYAMLFGLEKQWAKQFEDIYKAPPDWYNGNWTAFNAAYLASSVHGLSAVSSTTFSAPSSSSGSGFSGGSSGGGGGGGGGGGW